MYVLIVDDEPDLIDVIRETLISEEVFSEEEVLRAGNGAEALVIFEKQRPSLVMTDLNMPKMNGSELIRQIRERSPDTEIVVMTGHGDLNSAISLFPYKIVEFLRKPFNIGELAILAKKMRNLIELREQNAAFKEKLVQSEKLSSVGLLAAGIAHEINNPNTFVKGNLELVLRYLDIVGPAIDDWASRPGPEQAKLQLAKENIRKTVEGAINGSERIRKIVAALLVLGRHAGAEKVSIPIGKIVEEALSLTHYRVKMHDLKIEISESLPPCFVNEQEILQVLMNLFVNAVDAIEERLASNSKGLILVNASLEGQKVILRVKDNGCGIKAETIRKIFDPFYTTKPVGKGTGLGLSISKGLVERNGGLLNCESEVGVGTQFSIEVPVATEEQQRKGVSGASFNH